MIDLPQFGMSAGELKNVLAAVGGIDALLDEKAPNAALVKYLAMDEDKIGKLLDDPSLIKTPVVRNGRQGNRPAISRTSGRNGSSNETF